MAKKEEPKTVLERIYTIPLRRETRKVPTYRKAKKAITAIREFILRHMKPTELSIGFYLNKKIWEHGIKNPPGKVKVTAVKDNTGNVFVEIFGAPKEKKKEDEKTGDKKTKISGTKEKPLETRKEVKAEEAKEIEKEEIKELKKEQKEHPKKQHMPKQPTEQKMQEQHQTAPRHV